jgi:hypothetical protein
VEDVEADDVFGFGRGSMRDGGGGVGEARGFGGRDPGYAEILIRLSKYGSTVEEGGELTVQIFP